MTMYAINATTETTNGPWIGVRHSPTFYLDSNVQGIVSDDHAEAIVRHWLADTGLTVLFITAVAVES